MLGPRGAISERRKQLARGDGDGLDDELGLDQGLDRGVGRGDDVAADPPAGAPAWMATFADMATLLMAFFVLILCESGVDSEDEGEWME